MTLLRFAPPTNTHRFLFLPFLTSWAFYALDPKPGHKEYVEVSMDHPSPMDIFFVLSLALYFCSVPGHILWDVGFGAAMIARIQELRAQAAAALMEEDKDEALLALTRRTVIYVIISGLLTLLIHIPHLRLILFDAAVRATHRTIRRQSAHDFPLLTTLQTPTHNLYCGLFNLSFGILTHFCYASSGATTFVGWSVLWSAWVPGPLRFFSRQQSIRASAVAPPPPPSLAPLTIELPPAAAARDLAIEIAVDAAAGGASSLIDKSSSGGDFMFIPDPFAGAVSPRPPLPSIREAGEGEGDEEKDGFNARGRRARPESFIQSRERSHATSASAASSSVMASPQKGGAGCGGEGGDSCR